MTQSSVSRTDHAPHRMTGDRPVVIFLHYWGRGPAQKLATGFKAALDELGKGTPNGLLEFPRGCAACQCVERTEKMHSNRPRNVNKMDTDRAQSSVT